MQQEGQWFWKAVHILSRSTKLFTPAILQRGLVMTEHSYSERSTVGWHVFGGREAVDASLIVRFSQRLLLGARSRACLKARLCHRKRYNNRAPLHPVINLVLFLSAIIRPTNSSNGCYKQNGTAKRCSGQGLQIQEQFRKFGFGHTYPSSPRQSARPHGPRPR